MRILRVVQLAVGLLVMALVAGCWPNEPDRPEGSAAPEPTYDITTTSTPPSVGRWTPPGTGGTLTLPLPPGKTPAPSQEPSTPENPGLHDYGECDSVLAEGEPTTLVGTPGNDVLRGSAADNHICGMGGNDVIITGGGEDRVWGGPGNDIITGSPSDDHIEGGDGNDVIYGGDNQMKPGYDFLYGDTGRITLEEYDDSGDDVIHAGTMSSVGRYEGGPGNDIIVGPQLTRHGALIDAGPGKDVVVALNFSHSTNADHIDLDGESKSKVDVPISPNCTVKTELSYHPDAEQPKGSVDCDMPWPPGLSSLKRVVSVSASFDTDGKLTMDASLYQGLAKLSVESWQNMVAWQASLASDACICDPLETVPDDPWAPYDFPA